MKSRDRVRRALNFEEADRVPIDLGGCSATTIVKNAYERLTGFLKKYNSEVNVNDRMLQTITLDMDIVKELEVDVYPVYFRSANSHIKEITDGNNYEDDVMVNEWGIVLKRPRGGFYYDIISSPLQNIELNDLDNIPWPDPSDSYRTAGIKEEVISLYENTDLAIMGPGVSSSIFELCWYLRGFENFFMDLVENKKFVHALMRKVLEYRKITYDQFLKVAGKYLDIVYYADDLATQTNIFISLDMYREMIKPYQKEFIRFIKERTDAKLFYHCCGSMHPYLKDLIEIGVDIINPVQVSARGMDTKELKNTYGKNLVFWGAIDTQRIMPYGSVKDVESEVARRIDDLAYGGGYVLSAVHNIQPDVPPENVIAMVTAAKKYGKYI